jgi:hypothetical protein
MAKDNANWGYQRIQGELLKPWPPRQRFDDPQDPHSATDTASTIPTQHGGSSYAHRPPPCWPWTSSMWTAL